MMARRRCEDIYVQTAKSLAEISKEDPLCLQLGSDISMESLVKQTTTKSFKRLPETIQRLRKTDLPIDGLATKQRRDVSPPRTSGDATVDEQMAKRREEMERKIREAGPNENVMPEVMGRPRVFEHERRVIFELMSALFPYAEIHGEFED